MSTWWEDGEEEGSTKEDKEDKEESQALVKDWKDSINEILGQPALGQRECWAETTRTANQYVELNKVAKIRHPNLEDAIKFFCINNECNDFER